MDTVLDCVLHYIHDANDRKSFSLVSHMCYDIDAKTRKHVTAHLCYATPLRFRRRFPFIESVTLAGNPHIVDLTSSACNWDHNLTPWVQEIATSFKGLKMVRLQNLVVHDSDLELLARTLAERLMGLEIDSCSGFSTDGLLYIGKEGVNMKDPVDNGVRTLLIGCNKLERLSICFQELGGLSDIGLSYIGKFGCNLRYLSLGRAGESDAGLVELSFGCPKLQNLVISKCPFSKEAFDIFRCNVPSLRYFQVQGMPRHCRYLLEEDQPNFKQIV